MGSVFLSFALGCSHLPKNSILLAKRQFSACFSNCSISLNFKDKINCNTTKQNDLKWGKTYTGLKFDLVHFNGPQTKFICDSLYKHPVHSIYTVSTKYLHGIYTVSRDVMCQWWLLLPVTRHPASHQPHTFLSSCIAEKKHFECVWKNSIKRWLECNFEFLFLSSTSPPPCGGVKSQASPDSSSIRPEDVCSVVWLQN